MPRNFDLGSAWKKARMKDPRVLVRAVLSVLLLANVVAALFAFRPWGGSAEDLARQETALRRQLTEMQGRLARTKALVAKAEKAREEGDRFLAQYTTDRRNTFSIIVAELEHAAKETGIVSKPLSIVLEPIEGSDTLSQMTISAAYEGNYANLTKFVNLLDHSPRFLIIESMTAAPQQTGQIINVTFRLDTFVREEMGATS